VEEVEMVEVVEVEVMECRIGFSSGWWV